VLRRVWGDRTPLRIVIVWLYERAAAGEVGWGVLCTTAGGKVVFPKITSTLDELIPVGVLVGQAYGQRIIRTVGPRRIVGVTRQRDAARKKNPAAGKMKSKAIAGAPFLTLGPEEAFCATCNLFYEARDIKAVIATVNGKSSLQPPAKEAFVEDERRDASCESGAAKSEEIAPAVVRTPAQETALVIELAAQDWKNNRRLTRRELFDRIAGDDVKKRAPCAKDRVWRSRWTFYRFRTEVTKPARTLAGLPPAKRGPRPFN
jgi:hypothetical protein